MKKTFVFILFLLLLPLVSAFKISTEPAQLNFDNVLINGLTEKKVLVLTDSIENVEVSLTTSGLFEQWIRIEPTSAPANFDRPAEFTLYISPQQAQIGTYQGIIVVNAVYTGQQLTSAVASATSLDFNIVLTDKEIIQAKVNNIIVEDVEPGQPINVKLSLQNTGNKEINLSVDLALYDESQNLLNSLNQYILLNPSNDEKEIPFTFENTFPVGSYKIMGKILFGQYFIGEQTAPFKIVSPGTLPTSPPAVKIEPITLSSTPIFVMFALILAILVYFAVRRKHVFEKQKK